MAVRSDEEDKLVHHNNDVKTLTVKDAATGGGGFNTFGFLAFLLAGFNAISVVSNNNNNRNNNNNNQNNDNNNNNFQTLESSVTGMQMVGRRRRGAAGHTNMTSTDDVIMDEDTGALYTVMDRFMRAWVKNRLTSERGCHLLHICEANAPPPASAQSPEVVTFAEVATMGLAREVVRQEASTVEAAETEGFLAAGEFGAVILHDYHHDIFGCESSPISRNVRSLVR